MWGLWEGILGKKSDKIKELLVCDFLKNIF